jgi:hypothetical protein
VFSDAASRRFRPFGDAAIESPRSTRGLSRRGNELHTTEYAHHYVATAMLFASGYPFVWCGFSLAATLLQWGHDEAGL